jgi:hypothetical protein
MVVAPVVAWCIDTFVAEQRACLAPARSGWPSVCERIPVTGKTHTLPCLATDQFYEVREGDTNAVTWKPKTFHLLAGAGAHGHHHHE